MEDQEIKISHLTKYYGKKLALITSAHHTTECSDCWGRNGAGKTTLMKNISHAPYEKQRRSHRMRHTGGESGADPRKITGYLPQDFNMYPSMTVYEAMDYLGVLSGMDRRAES